MEMVMRVASVQHNSEAGAKVIEMTRFHVKQLNDTFRACGATIRFRIDLKGIGLNPRHAWKYSRASWKKGDKILFEDRDHVIVYIRQVRKK